LDAIIAFCIFVDSVHALRFERIPLWLFAVLTHGLRPSSTGFRPKHGMEPNRLTSIA
jgi:hypothetical protein